MSTKVESKEVEARPVSYIAGTVDLSVTEEAIAAAAVLQLVFVCSRSKTTISFL